MPLQSPPPTVVMATPAPAPRVVPELLWPSIVPSGNAAGYCERDHTKFPEERFIRWRYQLITGTSCELGLEALREQMYSATTRLLVLDLFFAEYGYPFLKDAVGVTEATDIRVVSKMASGAGHRDVGTKLRTLDLLRNPQVRDGRPPGKVEWKDRLSDAAFPHLHDRFAIVDDELWHFGATVGGGHPNLNAASRGWSVAATRALDFFEEVWRTL
jgi:hypothetical protein